MNRRKRLYTKNKKLNKALRIENLSNKNHKNVEIFIVMILLSFGISNSILYFGHQVVPNSDFPCFVRVGHELLSFKLPSSYKRAPVLGLLQASLSHFIRSRYPDLIAGWLLNALLHPVNLILFFLIGKNIIGKFVIWVTPLFAINPWIIQSLTQPIAETTLLFFILLAFYFILKRSKWCYLFTAITTMVRYEGAALILVAFIIDMICSKDKKERVKSFLYAAFAAIPLVIWMLGTIVSFQNAGKTHYLNELGAGGAFKGTLIKYIELIWRVVFYPLFIPSPKASADVSNILFNLSKIFAWFFIVFGSIYGLCKRNWKVLALLMIFVPYILIHILHSFTIPRYIVPVLWIIVLLCLYGMQNIWYLINKNNRIPKSIVIILQGVILTFTIIWLIALMPYLSRIAPLSLRSTSIPYLTIVVVITIFVIQRFVHKKRHSWRDICIAAIISLMVISNQFLLVGIIGNGKNDIEFKKMAEWYVENVASGEKLITSMSGTAKIFAPEHKGAFIHIASINANSPKEFFEKCKEKEITYVAWDSRVGFNVGGRHYRLWRIENIAMLDKPRSIGPYKFIKQIKVNDRRFINIFKL